MVHTYGPPIDPFLDRYFLQKAEGSHSRSHRSSGSGGSSKQAGEMQPSPRSQRPHIRARVQNACDRCARLAQFPSAPLPSPSLPLPARRSGASLRSPHIGRDALHLRTRACSALTPRKLQGPQGQVRWQGALWLLHPPPSARAVPLFPSATARVAAPPARLAARARGCQCRLGRAAEARVDGRLSSQRRRYPKRHLAGSGPARPRAPWRRRRCRGRHRGAARGPLAV